MSTGLLYDDRFLAHRPPREHPEHPGRLAAIWLRFTSTGLGERCTRVPAREATREELMRVHDAGLIDRIDNSAGKAPHWIDADTYVAPESAQAARLAAGGLVDLTLAVWRGELDNGVALVRPPGHHAERARSMGFCLFNNVAVAAAAARAAGAKRVAIVDWDLHHGNGTQDIFYSDGAVHYSSTHQHPLYPGTGALHELGRGEGEGATLNIPLPGGAGDSDFLAAYGRVVVPIVRDFDAQLVIVSAGFDASLGDPLGAMRVTPGGYAALTEILQTLAGGKLVLALEGGYNLGAIAASMGACAKVLLGDDAPAPADGPVSPVVSRILDEARSIHRRFRPGI